MPSVDSRTEDASSDTILAVAGQISSTVLLGDLKARQRHVKERRLVLVLAGRGLS
jgi:hypothetical protein